MKVSANNATPDFPGVDEWTRYSAISGSRRRRPGTWPGDNQIGTPGITPQNASVGETLTATAGLPANASNDGWFNPVATVAHVAVGALQRRGHGRARASRSPARRRRATRSSPATASTRSASASPARTPRARRTLLSAITNKVISEPAEIGDPLPPDVPGGPVKSQAPALAGDAYVGETLVGTVGGWKDPTTDFERRWVRCDAGGGSCTYIQKVASVDPEDGSTYVPRVGDIGYTLRLRVTADVNGDLTPDGLDNFLPHSVEVDTPQSAIVRYRPVPGAPPPPAPPPGPVPPPPPAADRTKPAISALTISKKRFVAGKGTTFRLRLSEPGSLRIRITRATVGRKVGKLCKPKTRKNAKRRRCTFQKLVTTLRRSGLPAGNASVKFSGKVGGRKLAVGDYTATFVVTDRAGNVSKASSLVFRIVRR